MKKKLLAITLCFLVLMTTWVIADDQTDLQNKIKEYSNKLVEIRQQKNTLSSQIQYMDTQIYLTQLRIQETEQNIITTQKEIDVLGNRIDNLDSSLNQLTELLRYRIVKEYKEKPVSVLTMVIDSATANDFFSHLKYLKTAQENNQRLIVQVQQQKLNFEEQKVKREEKKKELNDLIVTLDNQKISLDTQKSAKQRLLAETRNSEVTYQNLLAQAQAEYASIRGIIAGAGNESKIREVKKGETIAYLISGASCNSSGKHLHLMVKDGNSQANPFNYLKSISSRNCSGSSCDSSDGDPFNPSGNLDWPINEPIELEQGFGYTWAVSHTWVGRIYNFHDGIDINGSSDNVTAISDGDLYRGGYTVGCTLSYVKLVHRDSNITTYYLHVYSN